MNMAQKINTEEKPSSESTGKWILKNLIGAALFFAALVIVATITLNLITNHNETIEVPDLTNLSVGEAWTAAHRLNLRTEVTDSLYVRRMEKGAVYSQNPKPGTLVKKNRRIALTINALNAKKVSMPNLVGFSLRQAMAELNARGLVLGKLTYVDDIATNNVLRQVYRNSQIRPGRQIEVGSVIDLVVGLNPEDNLTFVPDVKNMKYLRAVEAVHDNSLNIGKLVFDKTVKDYSDSLDAAVYRQEPGVSQEPLLMGSEVTLYLSLDKKSE